MYKRQMKSWELHKNLKRGDKVRMIQMMTQKKPIQRFFPNARPILHRLARYCRDEMVSPVALTTNSLERGPRTECSVNENTILKQIGFIEQQRRTSKPTLQATDSSGTPASAVQVPRDSNDTRPFSSSSYELDQQSNHSKSRSIDNESSTDVDSEDLEFWTSDYSEGTPQSDDEHSLPHLYRKPAVDYLLSTFIAWHQGCMSRSRQNGSHAVSTEKAGEQPENHRDDEKTGQKRRMWSGEGQQGTNDDHEGVQKKRWTSALNGKRRLLLACPFAKKDPIHHRACYRQTLTKISYVKQHLSRSHRTPIYCPVCREVFENEVDRDAHNRLRSCEERPAAHLEGGLEGQRKQLQKRGPTKMSEEEQWFIIWDIIFPEIPRPQSPYVDRELSDELSAFRDFATGQGSALLLDHLRTIGFGMDSMVEDPEWTASLNTVIADGLQIIFESFTGARQPDSQSRVPSDQRETSQARENSRQGRSSTDTLVEDQTAIGAAPVTHTDLTAPEGAQNLETPDVDHAPEGSDQNLATVSTNNVTDFPEDQPQEELLDAPLSFLLAERENLELYWS